MLIIIVNNPLILSQDLALFINRSERLQESAIGGPLCKAFADVNGDYKDDIIRIEARSILHADIQSNLGSTFVNEKIGRINGDAWTISVGDFDNDGINDFYSSGNGNGIQIFQSLNKNAEFERSNWLIGNHFAQGSNTVDINNDGWLDAFVCNDDGLSKIYINDGNGILQDQSDYFDMRTTEPSDNSGNYASEWSDVDGDGDMDLYISKCRLNVNSFTDPRRINALFINHGDHFTEEAEEWGVAIGAQSWTGNFGDIDNDGDMDLFVANHEFRSQLFENIDNDTFVEIDLLDDKTTLQSFIYQSAFADFNNDGFLDILIAGNDNYLLLNLGNNHFKKQERPLGFKTAASFAIGDANNDGFMDIISSYAILGSDDFEPDQLWLNVGNENNFVSIALEGTTSNKSGIGTKLELYGDWGVQTRILQSGTGYGITNSLVNRFGLDDYTHIDSVRISWPSGIVDFYDNIEINSHYLAKEETCMEILSSINIDSEELNCNIEEVELNIPDGNNIVWSTGQILDSITVNTPGVYYASIQKEDQCILPSQVIYVSELQTPEIPMLTLENDVRLCEAIEIEIASRFKEDYLWQDNTVDESFTIESSGVYYASDFNICDTVSSEIIQVDFIDPDLIDENKTIIVDSVQSLILDSGFPNTKSYRDPSAIEEISENQFLDIGLMRNDTSFYFDFEIEQSPPIFQLGETIDKLDTIQPFTLPFVSHSLRFEVKENLEFNEVSCFALEAGVRKIQIRDRLRSEIVFEKEVDLAIGYNVIQLNHELAPSIYDLMTDVLVNIENFGNDGARLAILDKDVRFPYSINNIIEIKRSLTGIEQFPYFFDWKVQPLIQECRSPIFEYYVDIDTISSNQFLNPELLIMVPNPVMDKISISYPYQFDNISISNIHGQVIIQQRPNALIFDLDLSGLEKGIYILTMNSKTASLSRKLIKQ